MSAGIKQLLAPFVSGRRIDSHGGDTNWSGRAPVLRTSVAHLASATRDDPQWFCRSKRPGGCDGYVSESYLRAKGMTDADVARGTFETAWARYEMCAGSER